MPRGGTWNTDDVILWGSASAEGILRVAATGGEVTSATKLAADRGESSHRFPVFLPDGQHFLYAVRTPATDQQYISLADLRGTPPKPLFRGYSSLAVVPGSGGDHRAAGLAVVFASDFRLLRQALDPSTFAPAGDPQVLTDDVDMYLDTGSAHFSIGGNVLLTKPRSPGVRFEWWDRSGRTVAEVPAAAVRFSGARWDLSRDGKRVAMPNLSSESSFADLWILDVTTGALSRETSTPELEGQPAWDRDGRRIAFLRVKGEDGHPGLVVREVGSPQSERTFDLGPTFVNAVDWTVDGTGVIVHHRPPGHFAVVSVETGATRQLTTLESDESLGRLSPDGRLFAFVSEATGRAEVYLQALVGDARPRKISLSGGTRPRWSPEGRLYFQSGGGLWSAEVAGKPIDAIVPMEIIRGPIVSFGIVPVGDRFLASVQERPLRLNGILNWQHLPAR